MSDEVLEAIKSDSIEEMEKVEKELGRYFLSDCHYSIVFAMDFGCFQAAEFLAPIANMRRTDYDGCTPLHHAVNNPDVPEDLLRLILQYTPDVENELNYAGCEACIGWGYCNCHCKCEGTLLEMACLSDEDNYGTMSYKASTGLWIPNRGSLETIKLLLEFGADPNLASAPLEPSSKYHGPLNCLLQSPSGAGLAVQPPATAAQPTAATGIWFPAVATGSLGQQKLDLLLSHGTIPRAWKVTPPSLSPLVEACIKGDVEWIKEILSGNLERDMICKFSGDTGFHALAWSRKKDSMLEIAGLLLAKGLDFDKKNLLLNQSPLTPAEVAFKRRDHVLLQYLLELGVKIAPIQSKRPCHKCRPYVTYVYLLLLRAGLKPAKQACEDLLETAVKDDNHDLYNFLLSVHPRIARLWNDATDVQTSSSAKGATAQGATAQEGDAGGAKETVLNKLKDAKSAPPRLKSLTYNCIRRELFKRNERRSIFTFVDKLPIPRELKEGLILKNDLREDILEVLICRCPD